MPGPETGPANGSPELNHPPELRCHGSDLVRFYVASAVGAAPSIWAPPEFNSANLQFWPSLRPETNMTILRPSESLPDQEQQIQ